MNRRVAFLLSGLILTLVACGGGDGGSPTPATDTDGPSGPTPPPSNSPSNPEFVNQAPAANAGQDQIVNVGQIVTLDGSNSTDADLHPLAPTWTLIQKPDGSNATLLDPDKRKPQFTPDIEGTYVIELVVSDGFTTSPPDTVTVTVTGSVPVANAGSDKFVSTGSAVTLDGTQSTNPNSTALRYQWGFTGIPIGSTAELSNSTTATPSFVPDIDGQYFVRLVVNDGTADSAPDTVVITSAKADAVNAPPIADAGSDQSVATDGNVVLSGKDSGDPEGDPLTFEWDFVSVPSGSKATLSDQQTDSPSFIPDIDGTYLVRLIVNDGFSDSAEARVRIVADTPSTNSPPIADAGPHSVVFVNEFAFLDGTLSSDADGDELTYLWTPISVPDNTQAVLIGSTEKVAYFTPDVVGFYSFELTVSDGINESTANVSIAAISSPPPPVADSNVHVFSTDLFGEPVYLGCWTCSRFDTESIHNDFGPYGSRFSSTSIRNPFSQYGGEFRTGSACNPFTYSAPYMLRGDGILVGRLSVNEFLTGGICSIGNYSANDCQTLRAYCGTR